MRIQIVDLDGCISDDRHRRHHINPVLQRDYRQESESARKVMWHEYHSRCILDKTANLNEVIEKEVVVLTGRPVRYREQTLMWLREEALIHPIFLLMRNDNDRSGSVVLKERMVAGLIDVNSYRLQLGSLVLAIDDREDIVRMYQDRFGIPSKVVRIGEEEHDHA